MKRLLIFVLPCIWLLAPIELNAGNFGIVGGASFQGIKHVSLKKTTGYKAGFTYKFNLPLGFGIQPALLYHAKSSNSDTGSSTIDLKVGYLELPVSFQWGPDLLLFRPYIDISPFIGYGLNHDMVIKAADGTAMIKDSWKKVARFEYGVGLGAGLEIWKIQLSCKYNWNFGPLLNQGEIDLSSLFKKELGNNNFGGVTLSLALFF